MIPQAVIPVAAREGQNVVARGNRMEWHSGPTVLQALDHLTERARHEKLPLRLPVQDVYKFDHRRIIVGKVASGTLSAGDAILFSPSGRQGVVKAIERWHSSRNGAAEAGESIGITLTEQLFIERGEVISPTQNAPW